MLRARWLYLLVRKCHLTPTQVDDLAVEDFGYLVAGLQAEMDAVRDAARG